MPIESLRPLGSDEECPLSASYWPARRAQASRARGERREALVGEYIGYIKRVGDGEAGVFIAREGETTRAIRRRLGAAAEALGRSLEVRRAGNAVYFWAQEGRRRGRPRKTAATGQTPV